MTFRRILCATDFSGCARRALDAAIRIATVHGAELVVANAWQLPITYGAEIIPPDVVQAAVDDAKQLLDGAVKLAKERGVRVVAARSRSGAPWRAIVDLATEDPEIDLIVVGTHGRTGIRRVLLGSVAAQVVRHAPVSTLAVHPDDRVGAFGRILCPTDFSESATRAAQLAVELADTREAEIELVNVVDVPRAAKEDSHVISVAESLEKSADVQLERAVATLGSPVLVRWHVEIGTPTERLLARLDAATYDLVVVGSHGRTGLSRMLLGSVAELVVRHAHCPVLVARAPREPVASAAGTQAAPASA